MEKVLFTQGTTVEEREKYWNSWIEENQNFDEDDLIAKQIFSLVSEAVKYKQYAYPDSEFEDVTRLVRVRLRLSKQEIKYMFGLDPLSVYGEGLYLPLEGILLKPGTRNQINYDRAVATVGSKGQYLVLDRIPQDVVDSHKWGIAVPALDGLFVPKKSRITDWIYSTKAIQYFDLQIN